MRTNPQSQSIIFSLNCIWSLALMFSLLLTVSLGFRSDELLVDDEEFGLEVGRSPPVPTHDVDLSTPTPRPSSQSTRKRFPESDLDPSKVVQFSLEHAFRDSDFSSAGNFSARLKTWSHGAQTLTKLRFSRNAFTETEKENFKKVLEHDDFYRIRVPSNVLSPPGSNYVISAVKARCLLRDGLDEHFVIHTEGGYILAVNYGSPGACQYPRPLKLPTKWSFNSHTVLKSSSEQAPRTPVFSEDTTAGENGEGEGLKPPEKSFWAKYWMFLIPTGIIVMNAITQAMNMAEEQTAGQSASQAQQPMPQIRGQGAAVRRR